MSISNQQPELRFPEFKNSDVINFTIKNLADLLTESKKTIGSSKIPVWSVSNIEGFVSPKKLFNKTVASANTRNYKEIKQGYFAYNPARINIGSIAYNSTGKTGCVSPMYVVFSINEDELSPRFFYYLLQGDLMKQQIKKFAHGSVRQTVSFDDFCKCKIPLPPLKEQLKIVACLSSLDNIITAQQQRLTQLQQYKKGLLQHLFPVQGETIPKLRFPEFKIRGVWGVKRLVQVANVIAGQSPKGTNYNDKGVGTPFYQGKTDFGERYIKAPTKYTTQITKLAQKNDILMSVRAPVGVLNFSTDEICIGRGLAAIQARKIDKFYLYYFLVSIQNYIIGNGGCIFDSINKQQIENIKILTPLLDEQEKISACFSSLDNIIMGEQQHLKHLQQYKQGLLQQLFITIA